MARADAILAAVQQIYDKALEPSGWNAVLPSLAGVFRSKQSVLLVQNPASTTASLTMLLRELSGWRVTTWTSRQASDDCINQPVAHGGDRVWDVALRPQGRILWVGNLWVR